MQIANFNVKNILLVNPWICDFAAYDLWMFPLGLLNIASRIKSKNTKIHFLNLTDRYVSCSTAFQKDKSLSAFYGTGHFHKQEIEKPTVLNAVPRKFFRYGMPEEAAKEKIQGLKPDLILMTSGMTYWYVGIQQTIKFLRNSFGSTPVILGGVYAALCPEHARRASGADDVFAGTDITKAMKYLNRRLGTNINAKIDGQVLPAFELLSKCKALPVLGSKGCPFNCTYCASRFLYPDFSQQKPERVSEYIERCSERFKTTDFVFYDDALFVNRDYFIKQILESIIDKKLQVRFHTPNGLHAGFIDQELAELMRKTNFKTIRLSLESSSSILKKKSSAKVTNDQLKMAIRLLYNAGFKKEEIGVYTMLGFPGQKLQDIEQDIEFVYNSGAQIFLSSYSLVPQTKEWIEFINQGVISQDTDPLLLSHTAFPLLYGGFSSESIRSLRKKASVLNKKS